RGIGTLEQLAEVKRIVVEVARNTAILNADDPLCLKMADYAEAEHLCYVTMDPTHPLVGEHIRAGGRGVVLESGVKGQMITIYDHGAHIPLLWTHLIPATLEGRATHNVQNAMFAAAMAFSMGLKLEDIRHGLRTFDTTFFQAPGRMNIYDEHPFKVILDYGHNAAAVEAMVSLVTRLDVAGRRLVVLAAPGDRRDEDIAEIGRIAAGNFDRYICRRDDHLRGRRPDEVPQLLLDALLANGVPAERILVMPEEPAAVDTALREAEPGDLLLIFGDAITRTWKQVIQFRPDSTPQVVERIRPSQPALAVAVSSDGSEDHRREFVRDSRGVRMAREEQED
ncbi:MAG: glutamate ligase domain-containing protein, partial [Gemmatimonadales bacterium]